MAKSVEDKAMLIMGVFVIVTVLSYVYAQDISQWAKTAGILESVALYILTNPVYLLLVIYLSQRFHLRGFLASLLVVLALDIQSLPHVVVDGVTPEPTTYLFIDSIIFRSIGGINSFALYVILPVIMMIGAYELVSSGTFVRIVRRYIG